MNSSDLENKDFDLGNSTTSFQACTSLIPSLNPVFKSAFTDCIVDFNYRIAIKIDGTRRIRGYQSDNRNLYSKQTKGRFGCKKGVNSWYNHANDSCR